MTRKGIIKNKDQIHEVASAYVHGEGWHLKGQFFPEESLELSGKTFEFTKEWAFCWSTKINDEYRFISEDAINFDDHEVLSQ